jgi:ABC-type multidrug transport system fused ATPase/permease subunit
MAIDKLNKALPSTRTLLLSIWGHLSRRRRIQLCLLLVVMLASGGAELVSLGAVLPFLAVLSDPERLWQLPLVQALAARVGFTQASELLLPATLVFAAVAVLAALIRLANLWLNARLAAAVGSDLSCEAYRRTLYQPYGVHVQRNSAALITGTTTQINFTVGALNALLQLITSSVVAAGLLTGLLVIDAPVAVAAAALFGSTYGVLAITARRELRSNGQKIAEASSQQLKALQEGLGAIRDVLLDGSQPTYLQIYRHADRPQRQLQAKNKFLSTFPRYALEALGIVAIALLGVLLVSQRGRGASVIPLLGALALGALEGLQRPNSGCIGAAQPAAAAPDGRNRTFTAAGWYPTGGGALPVWAGPTGGAARAGVGDPPRRAHRADRQHRQWQEHHGGPADGAARANGRACAGGWDGFS